MLANCKGTMIPGLKLLFKGKRYDLDEVSIKLLRDEDVHKLRELTGKEQVRRLRESINALNALKPKEIK